MRTFPDDSPLASVGCDFSPLFSRRDGRSFSLTLSFGVTALFILPPRSAKVASLETLRRCCRAAR